MRRRHLESVSSRSLAGRGSWGTAPSVFWYGAPGGTRGPLGKGGAAERWRVTPSVSGVTRHRAQPATTRTHKRNASAASGANYAFAKGSAPPTGEMILWHNLCHQSSGSLRSPPPFTQGRLWDGALPLHRGGYGTVPSPYTGEAMGWGEMGLAGKRKNSPYGELFLCTLILPAVPPWGGSPCRRGSAGYRPGGH